VPGHGFGVAETLSALSFRSVARNPYCANELWEQARSFCPVGVPRRPPSLNKPNQYGGLLGMTIHKEDYLLTTTIFAGKAS
jgi:hypothetical protein